MKLTNMKVNNSKLDSSLINVVKASLSIELVRAGFITDIEQVNSQSIKIGLRGRSFKIDVNRLGYNAQYNPFQKFKLGYKRTCTPTWEQRVHFNNIVNEVLDSFNVSCNIKSGPFTIRQGSVSFDESDWENEKPEWMWHNESRGFKVLSIPKSEV